MLFQSSSLKHHSYGGYDCFNECQHIQIQLSTIWQLVSDEGRIISNNNVPACTTHQSSKQAMAVVRWNTWFNTPLLALWSESLLCLDTHAWAWTMRCEMKLSFHTFHTDWNLFNQIDRNSHNAFLGPQRLDVDEEWPLPKTNQFIIDSIRTLN